MRDYFEFLYPYSDIKDNDVHDERVWYVGAPLVYPFTVPNAKHAIIIIPGGAYFKLNPINNGFNFAEWLNTLGIDAYVLLHTLPNRGRCTDQPFLDCKRAMDILGDYDTIGLWGVSAGGHVAAMVKSDYKILFSPVITMGKIWSHANSVNNLLGDNPSVNTRNMFSAQYRIDKLSMDTFILGTTDDEKVHWKNIVLYTDVLSSYGKNCELHIYNKGGHDLFLDYTLWQPQLKNWLNELLGKREINGSKSTTEKRISGKVNS